VGSEKIQIYKIKKFACRALKGRGVQSGIRIIYAYWMESTTVDFLEIYFKADKEDEDKDRIKVFPKRKILINKGSYRVSPLTFGF